jgi:signal transduction histidine kinase
VQVDGDRDQLAQVAMNICLNAMKAIGSDGGRILVKVLPASDAPEQVMHCLRIENDGPAIVASEMENLFNPFHGSDPASAGLGLSIAQRLVEAHGGYIEAENAGLGVAFNVRLPARREQRFGAERG